MRSVFSLVTVAALLALRPLVAWAQVAVAVAPALAGLDDRVSLTALDTTLGQAAASLSGQTGYTIIADSRYRDLRVSLAGGEGTLAEVVSALCLATNLEARRLDRWIVLSPSARGIAVVAREIRAEQGPRLSDERRQLAVQRAAAARQALDHLGLGTRARALAQLNDWQRRAFDAQGYLTVAQLFPEYYLPLYDVFGSVIERPAERPASLPEFAGTRLYLDPALRLELSFPIAGDGRQGAWPIDVIPAAER